ncbi:MocR-like pyridoxine biosynthesis transcription factor PdxR [Brevibacillus migulae]|uniref:MocR-like pyridoxine biosynthesis transcription factor PdxR n=1 Tax=Brevibacillus migulae TaxID=1644114 RepID=UPI00106EFAD6|nr:PLP-dependent aminotransferase family protein [Brevibacillus migulae]
MPEITLIIDPQASEPIFIQIYRYVKEQIEQGRFAPDSRMPSIRKTAAHLQINKNTIDSAYQLLQADGYIYSKPKSGYYVSPRLSEHGTLSKRVPPSQPTRYRFRYNHVETAHFPFRIWNKLQSEHLRETHTWVHDAHAQGEPCLRRELCKYLLQTRGIQALPEQIIIGSGTQQLLSLVCQLMASEHAAVAIEEPGCDGARQTLRNHGFELAHIPIGKNGLDTDLLRQSQARLLYVNPSHQYLHRLVMPLDQRQSLLGWARECGGVIIEDDFEAEFRYRDRPLPAIAAMDKGEHAIYIGRFSPTLFPLFPFGYLVLPLPLLASYRQRFKIYEQPISRMMQKTLHLFMERGYWTNYVERARRVYAAKQDTLLSALKLHLGDSIVVNGKDAGLHVLIEVNSPHSELELRQLASNVGVRVYPTSRYWQDSEQMQKPTLLLGVGVLSHEEIEAGVKLLRKAWFSK